MREADREKIATKGGALSQRPRELPDWFRPVAEDVLGYCRPEYGLWVDLGCGSGGLGFALAEASQSTVVLIDPNADALNKAVQKARVSGLAGRVIPIVGHAESNPLPDASVDLVVSRGSIFFWRDPPKGLREVYRILRPDCRALIGGGFGSSYPAWAYKEFFKRRYEDLRAQGEEAVRKWEEPRRIEWLVAQAALAGIEKTLVKSVPPGRWLLFEKGRT
ncbi:MAG TPA: class I SAM-dependent methyltransferase [Phycisphaerae bacterium]|nr:class I SAM-dependent methyltransferase [Phycisphaerae bacterium]